MLAHFSQWDWKQSSTTTNRFVEHSPAISPNGMPTQFRAVTVCTNSVSPSLLGTIDLLTRSMRRNL